MADSSSRRRSSRIRSSPIRNLADDLSESGSQSSAESDSQDDTFKAAAAGTKRPRKKAPAKRSAKRTKTKPQKIVPAAIEEEEEDPDRVENFLYEAIMDSETSIETLVTDFLESYLEDASPSIKDLVNFILRCCGTKLEITKFDVEDANTIPETLEQLQDHLTGKDQDVVKVSNDTYPLVSKLRSFKTFRKDLADFWRVLITHAADKEVLYEEEQGKLVATIEAWLVSMSSSSLRSFRHTSTSICLNIMTTLVELIAQHEKDLETANKQLAAEGKKSKKAASKISMLQKNIAQKTDQSNKLTEFTSNYFDAVFVHRYRDVDPHIRSECVKELGVWMMKLPRTFFDGQYLRYLGWVLSDTDKATRLEVVKALTRLYGYDEYAGSLRHFTERFRPRILEIATEDAGANVRCAALTLVNKIRQRGYLEDEDTNLIIGCIFDSEEKIRDAVVEIFLDVLEERENEIIDEKLGGNVEDDGELKSKWTNLKAIVTTLNSIAEAQSTMGAKDQTKLNLAREQSYLNPGRVRIAARSFLPSLKQVELADLAEYLFYDNDTDGKVMEGPSEDLLKSALFLSENEEQILLELLVAAAEFSMEQAPKDRKNDADDIKASETIITTLPRLLERFSSSQKISTSLQLLTVCELSVYSKLRKIAQFEALLDTLIKIFFGYQEETLLRDIGYTLLLLSQEDSLNASLKDKFLDLQDTVRNAFLRAVAEEDIILALKRLEIVSATDDCALSFDDAPAQGKSIYSRLQELLSSSTIQIRTLSGYCMRNYFMWKIKQLTEVRFGLDVKEIDSLIAQRDEIFFILDAQVEEGDMFAATLAVDFEKIFTCLNEIESFDGLAVRSPLDVNLQTLMIKLLQKSMKKYSKVHNKPLNYDHDVSDDEEDEEEDEDEGSEEEKSITVQIQSEREVCMVAGEIVSAIAAEKMDRKYVDLLLSNKGKLGHSYDAILKQLPTNSVKKPASKAKAKVSEKSVAQRTPEADILMDVEGDEIEE